MIRWLCCRPSARFHFIFVCPIFRCTYSALIPHSFLLTPQYRLGCKVELAHGSRPAVVNCSVPRLPPPAAAAGCRAGACCRPHPDACCACAVALSPASRQPPPHRHHPRCWLRLSAAAASAPAAARWEEACWHLSGTAPTLQAHSIPVISHGRESKQPSAQQQQPACSTASGRQHAPRWRPLARMASPAQPSPLAHLWAAFCSTLWPAGACCAWRAGAGTCPAPPRPAPAAWGAQPAPSRRPPGP